MFSVFSSDDCTASDFGMLRFALVQNVLVLVL